MQKTDWWLPEGMGVGGRAKWVKGVKCMVTDGNKTFGGEHTEIYTEVELNVAPMKFI